MHHPPWLLLSGPRGRAPWVGRRLAGWLLRKEADLVPERPLLLLQRFRANLVGQPAGPRNEHSKARTPGPHPLRGYPAYILWYVAGSALGASNAARRS